MTPDHAFRLILAICVNTQIQGSADTRDIERIRARLTIFDAADLRLAAALLETVSHAQQRE